MEVAALTAEVAALKVKQEKKRLQEELELQQRAAREIKIHQERDEAARLKEEAELLAQCRQSKKKKSVRNLISKDSNSSEEESDENEAEECDSKDVDKLFKGTKKSALTVFSGDKDLYHDWKAQFEIFVDRMKVPAKTKMMILKKSLS